MDDEIKAAGGSATLVPLDLRELDRIDPLGPALYERFNKLDILVANAGLLGTLGPLSHHDAKLWNEVMTVNVTANWRLIRTLEPLLRRSDAGRAIFVTSGAASNAQAYWGAYATSKAALEMMVQTWAVELAKTNVRVNLLSPGPIRTAMRASAFPGEKIRSRCGRRRPSWRRSWISPFRRARSTARSCAATDPRTGSRSAAARSAPECRSARTSRGGCS